MVNFTMDFILLVIAQAFLKTSATYKRTAAAAAIGGVWSCIVEAGIIRNVFVRDIFTYILVCAVMAKICFGRIRLLELIKSVFMFIVLAASIGGAAGLLYWHTGVGLWFRTITLDNTGLFICLLAAVMGLTVVLREFFVQRSYGGKIHNVKIDFGVFVIEAKGLVDTGNVLYDPFCKKPVHIIEKSCLMTSGDDGDIYEKLLPACESLKLHYIPFNSVGCRGGCMPVIMAEMLYIDAEKCICIESVPIGISETKLSSDGMYQMLINSEVIKE